MSVMDAVHIVDQAKAVYRAALRQADSKLRQAVSQDPTTLEAAKSLQATYGSGFTGCYLEPNMQPYVAPVDAPTGPDQPVHEPGLGLEG